jgi:hypothetical protein
MKKISILPLLAFLFSFSTVQAQITKGSLFLGGSINFNMIQNKADSISQSSNQIGFTFSPVLGKAIKDDLIFGGSLIYSYNKYGLEHQAQKSYGYGAGVFLRKYKSIAKGFYIFLEGDLTGRYDKSDNFQQVVYGGNYKGASFSLSASPGISYAISKKLHLEMGLNQLVGLGYSSGKGDRYYFDGSTPLLTRIKTTSFGINTSLSNGYMSSISFGFRVLLGK